MKSIYLFLSTIILLMAFTGCEKEKDSENLSRTTYFVTFTFEHADGVDALGYPKVIIEKGDSYDVNQGFTAMEGENDVSDQAEIVGTVDGNTPGVYPVRYSAVNSDGYEAGNEIDVFVSDPDITTDISGSYKAIVDRDPGPAFDSGFDVNIEKFADGIFFIDRLLGSFYYDGYEYSLYGNYYSIGYVILNADNTLSYGRDISLGWGNPLDSFSGSYDPATGVVSLVSVFFGRTFYVTLTPSS